MKEQHILLIVLVLVFLALASYRATYALFSDGANSTGNTFMAAGQFPTTLPELTASPSPTPSPAPTASPTPVTTPTPGKIVVNEVFNAASSSAEWVEIYNSGGAAIDVSGWTIEDSTTSADILPVVTAISPGGFAVIVPDTSTLVLPVSAIKIILANGTIGNGLNASGDKLILRNSGTAVIDAVSFGNNHDVFTGLAAPASDRTLARTPNGVDTDLISDWSSNAFPSVGISNP